MSLINLCLLFLLAFVGWLFWLRRGLAETAINHVKRYCQQHDLQLISVSRHSIKLATVEGKPGWKSEFLFEFSGNQEDKYIGTLYMRNHYATRIDVPAYRTH